MSPTPDLRRIPRLAIALGGGGALGAAHVGVLEVLAERGIVPSIAVGTSAGAVIAAGYASGMDAYEMERLVVKADWGSFGTLSFTPGLGLLDTEGLRATVERIAGGDREIESFDVKYAAVATDAQTGELMLLDSGSVVDAMRASIAVPGLFRPPRVRGRLAVDGGMVQNLPIESAFTMGAEHVIAVRLAPEWDALPRFRTAVDVHEMEIRRDVTVIAPRLARRSQWRGRDIPGLVELGRQAAERALADYPLVTGATRKRDRAREWVMRYVERMGIELPSL